MKRREKLILSVLTTGANNCGKMATMYVTFRVGQPNNTKFMHKLSHDEAS